MTTKQDRDLKIFRIFLGIYYATVMVLTTGATILGVIVLRIHHQGRRGKNKDILFI